MAASYSMVVPPGFVRVPGGDVAAGAEALLSHLPPDVAQDASLVMEVRAGLANVVAADTARAVLDAFVVPGSIPGVELACSVVVSLLVVPSAQRADLDEHLLRLVTSRGATACSIGGDPAVVWDDRKLRGDRSTGEYRVVARRSAVSRLAGMEDHLMSIVLTVASARLEVDLSEDDRAGEGLIVDAMRALFDSMLASMRWLDDEGQVLVPTVDSHEGKNT
ncbi:hypothetical protein ACPEEZ_02475 [Frigoribacterium sp. 2-23]|uniref:hypothetical protein n=1 Tax=Frigoribacterium sp. 2-23 TaxID=3415006 RepID=UPI003C6FAECF